MQHDQQPQSESFCQVPFHFALECVLMRGEDVKWQLMSVGMS